MEEKLGSINLGTLEDLMKRDHVVRRLKQIGDKISKRQMFGQRTKLESQVRLEKQKALQILNPSQDFNEQNAVERWFKSKEAAEEERVCLDNWNKCAVEGERIGTRAFVRFANWARFTLGLEDKNRVASYSRTPK